MEDIEYLQFAAEIIFVSQVVAEYRLQMLPNMTQGCDIYILFQQE